MKRALFFCLVSFLLVGCTKKWSEITPDEDAQIRLNLSSYNLCINDRTAKHFSPKANPEQVAYMVVSECENVLKRQTAYLRSIGIDPWVAVGFTNGMRNDGFTNSKMCFRTS